MLGGADAGLQARVVCSVAIKADGPEPLNGVGEEEDGRGEGVGVRAVHWRGVGGGGSGWGRREGVGAEGGARTCG